MADVDVKLGAQTSEATSGITTAGSTIVAQLEKINGALQKMGQESKEQAEKTQQAFEHVNETVKEFGRTLAAAFGIRESIKALLDEEAAVRTLEIAFGMSAEKATEFNVQLQLAGITAETYTAMAFKVGRILSTQADEFDRLKVSVKDASGNFLPMDEILGNIYKRMQDFKAGTDQNEFALATIGRSAKDFASDMERLGRTQERATQLMAQFGIEMSPERQAEIERYSIEVNAFKIGIEEVAQRIGEALLPILERMATWFTGEGKTAIEAIEGALKGIATAVVIVGAVIGATGRQIGTTIGAIVTQFGLWADAVSSLARRDWAGVANAARASMRNVSQYVTESLDNMVKSTADAVKKVKDIWAGNEAPAGGGPAPVPKSGSERFRSKPTGGGDQGAEMLAAWRDELRALQEAEGYFHEFSKAQEAEFWQAKLALVKGNGKQEVKLRQEIHRMIFDDRKAAAREELETELAQMQQQINAAQYDKDRQIGIAVSRTALIKSLFGEESKEYARVLDQELKIREQWVAKEAEIMKIRTKMEEARAQHDVNMQRLALDQSVALRQVGAQQQFAIEKKLEDQIYAMKLAALEREKASLIAGTAAYEKVNAEIEALEASHQEKLTQIANKAELDRQQFALQAADAVQNTFATVLDDLMNRTKSWKDIMLDAVKSITASLNKLVAENIAKQLFGAGSEGGGILSSIFGALFKSVPSFDVGTPYVPRDTLALVHRGERVVPAAQNKGGGAGDPFQVVNHFHINGPVDSRTQDQIAASAARATQRAMYRNL